MKTKTILLSSFLLFAIYFFVLPNASASYIGTTSGNDNVNDPTNVLGVITSDPDYDPNDYDFTENPLEFFTKLDGDFTNVAEKTTFSSGDVTIEITKTKSSPNKGEAIAGTWTSTSPVDFIVIKAGNGFAVYSADQTTNGVWSGDWSIEETDLRVGKKGNIPGLSHFSAYKGGNSPPDGGQVPEPATVFLLGSGLLGLFGFRKKFWKPKK